MINKDRITLIGLPPSPYTRKMIALLRYRQIPYQVIWEAFRITIHLKIRVFLMI